MIKYILMILMLVISGCDPSTPEDFYAEGDALLKEFLTELKSVKTLKDLDKKQGTLRKKYKKLAFLILLAREKEQVELTRINPLSSELAREMQRIYLIPGAPKILEKSQDEALVELSN